MTLLFDDEYVDYKTRLFEANQAVRRAYNFTAVDLAERITSLSADLFFVRLDQESRDGTIPFKQAQRALENISTMVRAAATTAANPNHSHRGRRPAEVVSFLDEDLRLGHTKKGSFVVTAAARFDSSDFDESSDPASSVGGSPSEPATEPAETSHHAEEVYPFGRRVMATLSRGLAAARAVATDEQAVGTAMEQGLSLELAEALDKISAEEGLRTIEISFDWSPAVPAPPADVPAKVTFDREIMLSMPEVIERLQVLEKPKEVEIIGSVITLSRNADDAQSETSGEVTVLGEVDGKFRKVLVELHGEQHDYAIRAYRERFPVLVRGELVKKRSWMLQGDVSLDLDLARTLAVVRSKSKADAIVESDDVDGDDSEGEGFDLDDDSTDEYDFDEDRADEERHERRERDRDGN